MSFMGRLVNISVKVPEDVRELIKKVDVNWSELLREVIMDRVRLELAKEASKILEEIRKSSGKTSTEEIVRWIREERMRSLDSARRQYGSKVGDIWRALR
jgi:hypothetical protein